MNRKRWIGTILAAVLMMALVYGAFGDVVVPAQASASSETWEVAYAAVFERIINDIYNGNSFFLDDYARSVGSVSEVSYAFYDIDGNGVSELIIGSSGGGAIAYTLYSGNAIELAYWYGYRHNFIGINELGYMVGYGSGGAAVGTQEFYKMTADGSGATGIFLGHDGNNYPIVEYTIYIDNERHEITEAEYQDYENSLNAPFVELEWRELTNLTGLSLSAWPLWKQLMMELLLNNTDGYYTLLNFNGNGSPVLAWNIDMESEGEGGATLVYLSNGSVVHEWLRNVAVMRDPETGETALYTYDTPMIGYSAHVPYLYKISFGDIGIIYTPMFSYHADISLGSWGGDYILDGDILRNFSIDIIQEGIDSGAIRERNEQYGWGVYWNFEYYDDLLYLLDDKVDFYRHDGDLRISLPAAQYSSEAMARIESLERVPTISTIYYGDGGHEPGSVTRQEAEAFLDLFLEQVPQLPEPPPPDPSYIYDPLAPPAPGATVRDRRILDGVRDAGSAVSALEGLLRVLTQEEKESGDALDESAFWLENILRQGTRREIRGGSVTLDASNLGAAAQDARMIREAADALLSENGVGLLRAFRTNLLFGTDDAGEISLDVAQGLQDLEFDRVTVSAPFASVTLEREALTGGQRVEIRPLGDAGWDSVRTDGSGGADSAGGDGSGGDGIGGDGAGGGESAHIGDRGADGETDSRTADRGSGTAARGERPTLMGLLLRFWCVAPIAAGTIAWLALPKLRRKAKAWMYPAFLVVFIAANAATFFLLPPTDIAPIGSEGTGARIESPSPSDDSGGTQPDDGSPASAQMQVEGLEVSLENISKVTVSFNVGDQRPDYLAVYDGDGRMMYSKYNPATETIDASVGESGAYFVRDNELSFIDIEKKNDMMQEAILQLTSKGIMAGTTDGMFFPDKAITRAEFVSAIVRVFGLLDMSAESTFTDMDRSDWYYAAAATAQRDGIVGGFEDNTFRGDLDMPKDQMILVASNTLVECMNYGIPREVEELLQRFIDRADLRSWSLDGIALAVQANLLIYRADSRFDPRNAMTRGDAAIILHRVFNKVW